MDYQNQVFPIPGPGQVAGQGVARTFMANVFLWMFAALGISAVTAYLFASNPALMDLLYSVGENGKRGMTGLGMIVSFAPLGFVLLMSFGYSKLSPVAMIALFVGYAVLTGMSLSFILLFYKVGSVVGCFAASSLMFGVMAIMGYTTKQDLTSMGRLLMMALVGIIIASIINMFMHSEQMDYIISIIGVIVFTGLTAYDVQKLKRIGAGIEFNGAAVADVKKTAILGALNLYLDFINLFLLMLRLFGNRRN